MRTHAFQVARARETELLLCCQSAVIKVGFRKDYLVTDLKAGGEQNDTSQTTIQNIFVLRTCPFTFQRGASGSTSMAFRTA